MSALERNARTQAGRDANTGGVGLPGGGQPVAENEPALKEEWLQALALYGQGKTTDEIAEGCFLSHRGAENRLRRAREALSCATPREAVVEAARRGLL